MKLTDEEKKIVKRYRNEGQGYPFHSDSGLLELDEKNKKFEKELRERGFISVEDSLPEMGILVEGLDIRFEEEGSLVVVRGESGFVIPNTDDWVDVSHWKPYSK